MPHEPAAMNGGITGLCHGAYASSAVTEPGLLKFARDRSASQARLREHLRQFDLSILDYCLTSDHVHLLVDTSDRSELSGFLRAEQGEFARAYNRRKHRTNAFWGDNYYATWVEGGQHLWRCVCYIEH